MEIHGTQHPVVSYTKDPVFSYPGLGPFPGAMGNLENWRTMNGCKGKPVESWREGEHFALTYDRCRNGSEVTVVTINEGGHVIYPGAGSNINTTEIAWDFMKRFSK